ncbi:hypothetical protein HDU76_001061 [Blyttiomyces sp. JEL0837]|nr:hypothetical protein HDU76_001061 [Blyttiomyces sp. JEL0837]
MRTEELFDIIIEFPSTQPAIDDLRICVCETGDLSTLVESLSSIFMQRLLHPGANTSDILFVYISSLKCLSYVDPSGLLVSRINKMVKSYLRKRSDSMRCVIDIINEDSGELFEKQVLNTDMDVDSLSLNGKRRVLDDHGQTDIIGILIGMFDSTDIFVREFQSLLANRLLSSDGYEIDQSVRNVELLKKYFPESKLNQAEVMIKDIVDSKRLESNLKNQANSFQVNHRRILDEFNEAYSKIKSMRGLKWLANYGRMQIELELKDRVVELSVSTVQAALIMFFEDKASWTVNELAEFTGRPAAFIEKQLIVFIQNGVIRKSTNNLYRLQETVGQDDGDDLEMDDQIDSVDTHSTSTLFSQSPIKEDLSVFWPFIHGMLTNLGQLPAERIHLMLSQFVQTPKFTSTLDRLKAFLHKMVAEEKLGRRKLRYGELLGDRTLTLLLHD